MLTRDVEDSDLVCALLVVALGESDGLAEVAHVPLGGLVARLLAHVVLVALGAHQVAVVVGAHVHARDHALAEARRRVGLRGGRERPGGHGRGRARGGEEVGEQREPDLPGLLRVELARGHRAAAHRRHVPLAVVGRGEDGGAELGGEGDSVRVDEVDGGVGRQAGDERRLLLDPQRVPPDLRHGAPALAGEARDGAGKHAEPGDARALLARLEEGLQAEADAKVRPIRLDVLAQGLHPAALRQHLHAPAERADARKDEHLRRRDLIGRADERHLATDRRERVQKRSHVARAVVEDAHLHSSRAGGAAVAAVSPRGRTGGSAETTASEVGTSHAERATPLHAPRHVRARRCLGCEL